MGLISHAEPVEMESHGTCFVATEKDDFTDKVSFHVFGCEGQGSSDSFGDYGLGAACFNEKTVAVSLKAGIQLHFKDYVQVKYRFGKDQAEITNWEWSSGSSAMSSSRGTHDAIINRLRNAKKGEKFIFQVGDNKGAIKFTGEESAAVVEYLKRCSNIF